MDEGSRGTRVAGYRIEEPIGRGGMAEVFRATDLRLARAVALKLLSPRLADDGTSAERLLRESRLAASLDHPNVVPIYEAGDDDGQLFIAMRYVGGGDLRGLLRREGALEPARAVELFRQIADALDAAHRLGLVHRDVKPSNVLLDRDGGRDHCYLADFGLTQSAAHDGAADGQTLGTVDYVSPEQIRGDTIDGRADQYGLACLMFECLTGSLPFHHNRSDVAALFAHLEEAPPSAGERRRELPAAIDPVLARGMAKEPEDRFASCAALVAAAADALDIDAPGRVGRVRWVVPALVTVVAAVAALVVILAGGGGGAVASPAAGELIRIDAASGKVAGRTEVRGSPGAVADTPGGVWMADFRGGTLWRYQPGAAAPERIASTGAPRDLAAVGGKVYVGADGGKFSGVVSTYDSVTGIRKSSINLLACALAGGEGVVWAAGCPYVQRLSTGPGDLRILHQVFLPFRSPATAENSRVQFRELAVGGGSVWVLGDALDRRLWRLDARTGRVEATIPLGFQPFSVAVAAGSAWVTDDLHDRVFPFAARGNRRLAAIPVGRGASAIATGARSVWVANTIAGSVSRIDPRARRVTATIDVGGTPRGIAVGGGSVWVTSYGG